jgi:predicted hydrolase (HD superfamily)
MDKMLFAFDELSGLIHAYSLMRPGGYESMDLKGVKKRLKENPLLRMFQERILLMPVNVQAFYWMT